MSTAGPAEMRQRLLALLTPVVEKSGYDLEDISVTPAGRRSLVRVSVDADGGIDLDAVAEVTRAVSEALDAETPGGPSFAGPYVLEVSSPGVDRPLTEPRHWRRNLNRLVSVTVDGKQLTGRITAVDDAGVTLRDGNGTRQLSWNGLGPGKVQIEFNRDGEGD
jgi:ribosome maturation factor RimP